MAPRPRSGELRSGWLRRVAGANALSFSELLHAMTTTLSAPLVDTVSLDHDVPRSLCDTIASWCRLQPAAVKRLDLAQLFPTTPAEWFVHHPDALWREGLTRFAPVSRARFCPACLRKQQQRSDVLHLHATWSLAWLTHCPTHQNWLVDQCVGCHKCDALDLGPTTHGVIRCRFCGASLNVSLRPARLPSPVLQLQRTLLACSLERRPDPLWVGRCGPPSFLRLTHDLLALVMLRGERDQGVLADYLPERDWDFPRLRLRAHHRFPTLSGCERFTLLSAVAAVLLGPPTGSLHAIDPLFRLWQVLAPPRRRALLAAGRRWPKRIRERLLAARHSTIQIHRSTI